ncbi:MAG: hypothetical protein J6A58_12665 [Oscillospiraceae bacterium]|nr:hypothetical protein [Oscillospiraceae bacterium]
MKKQILLMIVTILFLTSCAETPDEVKEDMSSYRDLQSSVSDENSQFSYIKVSDLENNAEIALKKDYGQFSVSDKINFVQPDAVNIMEFSGITGFVNKSKEAMSYFFSESVIDSQNIQMNGDCMFMNEEEKIYCGVGNDGFIAMLNPQTFDISFLYNQPVVKVYHANRNDDLSDEYELNDKTCSVQEAVDYINNWLDTEYKKLSPDFDYNVNTVVVREYNSKCLFQIITEAVYEGVHIDNYTRQPEIKNGELTGKTEYSDYGIEIQMVNKNSIDSFTNLSGIYIPSVKETVQEVISMESALSFCEKTFTDFKDVEISDIRIMYTLQPVYNTDKETIIGEKDVEVTGYSSRPVWEIIMDVPPEFLPENRINTRGDLRKYIYIDMITGEYYYCFDI